MVFRLLTFISVLGFSFFGLTTATLAQSTGGAVSITVAPTLVELSMAPGEIWRSSVKVINTNPFPLQIFTEPAHFSPVGEAGQSSVVPLSAVPEDESLLVSWIEMEADTFTIAPGASVQVPFIISTPEEAAPGSHFAAIQISTVPRESTNSTGLNTAQVISSLLFVRVEGAITESAHIRTFTSTNSFSVEPKTNLSLRVENEGNVHVQPIGEIIIRNVWGAERGRIPVNYNTSFGNALPGSIREYTFAWQKEPSLFDIGYYTAEASLAYGVQSRQFLNAETSFWVIPVKPLLITLAIIGSIIAFIFLVSRWYITMLLRQAGVSSVASLHTNSANSKTAAAAKPSEQDLDLSQHTSTTLRPVEQLQHKLVVVYAWLQRTGRTAALLWQYVPSPQRWYVVLGSFGFGLALILILGWLEPNRATDFSAQIGSGDNAVTYNAEEITFFQQPGMTPDRLERDDTYTITLVNESNTTGAAGQLAAKLVTASYPVGRITAGQGETRRRTVITFPVSLQEQAVALSDEIEGALLSAEIDAATSSVITVYVGVE